MRGKQRSISVEKSGTPEKRRELLPMGPDARGIDDWVLGLRRPWNVSIGICD